MPPLNRSQFSTSLYTLFTHKRRQRHFLIGMLTKIFVFDPIIYSITFCFQQEISSPKHFCPTQLVGHDTPLRAFGALRCSPPSAGEFISIAQAKTKQKHPSHIWTFTTTWFSEHYEGGLLKKEINSGTHIGLILF